MTKRNTEGWSDFEKLRSREIRPLKDKRERFLSSTSILFWFFSLLSPLVFLISAAQAESRYWVASSDSNWNNTSNWSTTSGGSGGSSVPGSSDDVYFDSVRVGSCSIDAAVNVNSFTISGYSGTITQQSGNTITVPGAFSQSSGTFTGGDSYIDINGNFSLSGGTFTSTSNTLYVARNWTRNSGGGTFNHNNGTVTLDGGWGYTIDVNSTETFYNLTLNKAASSWYMFIANNDVLRVTGALSLTSGYFSGSGSATLEAQGNVTVTGNYYAGANVPLLFSGGNAQTFDLSGATSQFDAAITVNKSGGQINLSSDLTMDAGAPLTLTAGTLNLNGRTVTVDCSSPTCDPEVGTITVGGTVTIAGTGTLTSYTYTQSGTSSMTFSGASTFTVGAGGFSLTTGTFTPNNATMTVNGACTINSGTFNAPSGTLTINGAFTFSSGTFTGSAGSMSVNGNFSSSGTFSASSTSLDINGSFTLSSGAFTAPSGNMYVSGNWTHNSAGTFTHNNGTVTLDGGYGVTIDVISTETFNNLTLNKASSSWYMFIANNDTLKTTRYPQSKSGLFFGVRHRQF